MDLGQTHGEKLTLAKSPLAYSIYVVPRYKNFLVKGELYLCLLCGFESYGPPLKFKKLQLNSTRSNQVRVIPKPNFLQLLSHVEKFSAVAHLVVIDHFSAFFNVTIGMLKELQYFLLLIFLQEITIYFLSI